MPKAITIEKKFCRRIYMPSAITLLFCMFYANATRNQPLKSKSRIRREANVPISGIPRVKQNLIHVPVKFINN